MPEIELTPKERQQLKGAAHRLDPVVSLGANGLTDAVIREIDRALAAHELIKVRVPGDDRAQRDDIFRALAERLGAARVQSIGKLLVLFRPRPEAAQATAAAPRTRRTHPVEAPAVGLTQTAAGWHGSRAAAPKPVSRPPAKPIKRTARRMVEGKPRSRNR